MCVIWSVAHLPLDAVKAEAPFLQGRAQCWLCGSPRGSALLGLLGVDVLLLVVYHIHFFSLWSKCVSKKAVRDASLTMLVSSRLVYSNQVVSVSFQAGEPPDVLRHLLVKVRVPIFGGISRHRSRLSLTGIRGKLVGLA